MADFYNSTDRDRLRRAITASYRKHEPFRTLTKNLIEEYAGSGYGDDNGRPDTYLNLIRQAIEAYLMALAANRPQILTTTRQPHLKAFANHYQLAVNNLLKEIGLEYTLREWLLSSLFGLGVVKVHLASSPLVEVEQDIWMDPGSPFASCVSIDDFVYDTSAQRAGECKFMGDMYRIPFSDLEQEPYDQEVIKRYNLQPNSKFTDTSGDTIAKISLGQETDNDEYEPMIDLCDVWIAREQMIYTFSIKQRSTFEIYGQPLAVMPWDGSEHGPYHWLSFIDVPSNIMPASIVQQLAPLSRGINNIIRKQFRRARRSKDVHTFTAAGAEDAKRVQKASDGDFVRVNDPQEIGSIQQSGVDPQNQMFMLNGIELFDRMGGNLTAMLGLGKQASTVGQEELIHAASSRMESHMSVRYVTAVERLIRDLARMLWADEFKTIPGEVEVPGDADLRTDSTWTPGFRQGEFADYEFEIDVFKLSYRTPGQRLQSLQQMLIQVFAPMMPFLQQQGGAIDMQQLTRVFSELMGEPRLLDIVTFATPYEAGGADDSVVRKPPSGTREYVRRNVSEGNSGSSSAEGWSSLASS